MSTAVTADCIHTEPNGDRVWEVLPPGSRVFDMDDPESRLALLDLSGPHLKIACYIEPGAIVVSHRKDHEPAYAYVLGTRRDGKPALGYVYVPNLDWEEP